MRRDIEAPSMEQSLSPLPAEDTEGQGDDSKSSNSLAQDLFHLRVHPGALIRSKTRENLHPRELGPFVAQPWLAQRLHTWSFVNCGGLVGFSSNKGGKSGEPHQDEFAIIHEDGHQFYLVTCGRGEHGPTCSQQARRHLVSRLISLPKSRDGNPLSSKELSEMLREVYVDCKVHGHDPHDWDACIAALTPARCLLAAWTGNCTGVVGSCGAKGVTAFTEVNRADVKAKAPCDIGEFEESDVDAAGVHFIALCSSGLWRGVPKQDAGQLVREAGPWHAQYASDLLVAQSQDKQMASMGQDQVEDATAIVAWIGTLKDFK